MRKLGERRGTLRALRGRQRSQNNGQACRGGRALTEIFILFTLWSRGMAKLCFSECASCGHEVAFIPNGSGRLSTPEWRHHISRARLYGAPHWPTGHVLTRDCKTCKCTSPGPKPGVSVREKYAFIGLSTEPLSWPWGRTR